MDKLRSCLPSGCSRSRCCPVWFCKKLPHDDAKPSERRLTNFYAPNAAHRLDPSFIANNDIASPAILSVLAVDICVAENGRLHHTERYNRMRPDARGGPRLVVRRGQPFLLRLTLNRKFVEARDSMSFLFRLVGDEKASQGHGTLVGVGLRAAIDDLSEPHSWGSCIEAVQHDHTLIVLVKPAANAAVGEWLMDVDTQCDGIEGIRSYRQAHPFYVLFNPWCRDDQVFMEEQEDLEEYILADTTLIWRGSYNRLRPTVWKLGQFDEDVLDCSLLLIGKIGKLAPSYRGDPVKTARILAAIVNANDDNGALLGNWSTDFSGGTPPTRWIGSTAIMQQFYKKQKPVKYAQCWVFSGVLSTISRALGLPSRIITNYSSAHDGEGSLTMDHFVDAQGRAMNEMSLDSVWNYHVWNELWMDRPDLGMTENRYGGWQVVDATPQESSDGIFRCGPSPVLAVKLGHVLRPYDTHFVFAEVNADNVFWRYNGPSEPLKLLSRDTVSIGRSISTKMVGRWEREDVTSTYKFSEKSRDERDTMETALRQANHAHARYYLNAEFNDVSFDMQLLEDIKIGETFSAVVIVENRSSERSHCVSGTLNVDTVVYTGSQRNKVKSMPFSLNIAANTKEVVRLEVAFGEYYLHIIDEAAFNISCMAKVKDTEYEFFAQDDFRARKPDIKFAFDGEIVAGKPVNVTVQLLNSLPIALRKCQFQIEGTHIDKQLLLKVPEVPAAATATATFEYTPLYAGRASMVAKLSSRELSDVDGFKAFEVQPRPEDVIFTSVPTRFISRTDVLL